MIFIARHYKDIQSENRLPYYVHLLLAEMFFGTKDVCRELGVETHHSRKTCTVQGAVGHPPPLR